MSDDTTTPNTPAPTPGPAPVAQPETFSKEYVQELRGEAARYRNEKKDAVEAARAALNDEWTRKHEATAADNGRLSLELGDAWIALQRLYSAIDEGVPTDKIRSFADMLKGNDAESIGASAKSAKSLFGGFQTNPGAVDPTQGSGGQNVPGLNSNQLLDDLKRIVGA